MSQLLFVIGVGGIQVISFHFSLLKENIEKLIFVVSKNDDKE
jgi:hypothetical protein